MENSIQIYKLKDAPTFKDNPFVAEMMGEMKIKRKTQMMKSSNKDTDVLLVNSDGEISGHSAFIRTIQVDEDKFTKLFVSQLGLIWSLEKTALRVLTYFLSILKPNDDRVYFDMEECSKYCSYKNNQSVYDGLIGLINAKIIARTSKHYIFYINPAIVFNGSRVTFATTYVKKKNAIKIDKNQTSLLDEIAETE